MLGSFRDKPKFIGKIIFQRILLRENISEMTTIYFDANGNATDNIEGDY